MSTSPDAPGRQTRAPRWRARLLAVSAAAGLTLVAAACSSSPKSSAAKSTKSSTSSSAAMSLSSLETPPTTPVTLTEAGSTLLEPLFEAWAPAYQALHSNITVSPAGGGSGTGISEAASGTIDVGASDAYLSSADTASTPSLENIPLAISAQEIVYNIPGFTGTLKLNGQILSDIYQGTITNWDAPQITAINKGVTIPSVPIVALHRSDGSGDTFLFTTYLSDQDPSGWGAKYSYNTTISWPAITNSAAEDGNSGMVAGCDSTAGCVAYIGVSYQSQIQADHLGEAELENGAGNYEALTPTTVTAEADAFSKSTPANGAISLIDSKAATDGYPIINYEYAVVNTTQSSTTTGQAIKALLAWCIDPNGGSASKYLSAVNFQPLPSSAVSVAEKLISDIQ